MISLKALEKAIAVVVGAVAVIVVVSILIQLLPIPFLVCLLGAMIAVFYYLFYSLEKTKKKEDEE